MKISILTMFPEMMDSLFVSPITRHALDKNLAQVEVVDIRKFAKGSFRHIDDSPYGGKQGMLIRYDVLHEALASIRTEDSFVGCPIPAGIPYTQKDAISFSKKKHLVLIAGHYEGLDGRVYDECDALVSLGDYILSGGEFSCMNVADSVLRLLDGVMKPESTQQESFADGLLEYPQYTRPSEYNGKKVPAVLLSGNHEKIAQWQKEQAVAWTKKYRPDLLGGNEEG